MQLFKTNINCSSCVENVNITLNELVGEDNWEVDTNTSIKLLTINNELVSSDTIIEALKEIGYSAVNI